MQLTKDFAYSEMKCKCGQCDGGTMSPTFMAQLQNLRDLYGAIEILSGYRCEAHNKAVGGSRSSFHLKGLAADCAVLSSKDRHRFLTHALNLGFTTIIYETFVHIDVRADGPKVIFL